MMKINLFLITLFLLYSCSSNQTISSSSDSVTYIPEENVNDSVVKEDTISKEQIDKWSNLEPVFYNREYDIVIEAFGRDKYSRTVSEDSYRGCVYLTTKQFSGHDVPFVGYTSENISSLYVNNKKISIVPGEEFFFRQYIELYIGYNRIPVKIINKKGKVLKTYIEINMVNTGNDVNLNIN